MHSDSTSSAAQTPSRTLRERRSNVDYALLNKGTPLKALSASRNSSNIHSSVSAASSSKRASTSLSEDHVTSTPSRSHRRRTRIHSLEAMNDSALDLSGSETETSVKGTPKRSVRRGSRASSRASTVSIEEQVGLPSSIFVTKMNANDIINDDEGANEKENLPELNFTPSKNLKQIIVDTLSPAANLLLSPLKKSSPLPQAVEESVETQPTNLMEAFVESTNEEEELAIEQVEVGQPEEEEIVTTIEFVYDDDDEDEERVEAEVLDEELNEPVRRDDEEKELKDAETHSTLRDNLDELLSYLRANLIRYIVSVLLLSPYRMLKRAAGHVYENRVAVGIAATAWATLLAIGFLSRQASFVWVSSPSTSNTSTFLPKPPNFDWMSRAGSTWRQVLSIDGLHYPAIWTRSSKPTSTFKSLQLETHLPEDAKAAFVKRIEELETAVKVVEQRLKYADERMEDVKGLDGDASKGVHALQAQLFNLISQMDVTVAQFTNAEIRLEKAQSDSKTAQSLIEEKLHALTKSFELLASRVDDPSIPTELQSLVTKVAQVSERLEKMESTLPEVSSKIAEAVKRNIETFVPPLLVATKDPEGKIILDHAFYMHLKHTFVSQDSWKVAEARLKNFDAVRERIESLASKADVLKVVEGEVSAFASKADMDKTREQLQSDLDDHRSRLAETKDVDSLKQKLALAESTANSKMTSDDVHKMINMHDFSATIRERVNEVLRGGEGTENKLVLTRQEVLEILEKDVKELQGDAVGDLESIRARLAALEQEKNSPGLTQETITPLIEALIQRSLRRYTADVIAKADYALASAGAWVVPGLTSPTFSTPAKSMLKRWMGQRVVKGWGPFFALTPGNVPGQCWSMHGTEGTIGIHLAMPVIPTAFTIDHIPVDLALSDKPTDVNGSDGSHFDTHPGLSSSPKDVELWAVLNPEIFSSLNLNEESARALPKITADPQSESEPANQPAAVLLSTSQFDPRKDSVQTFPVNSEAAKALKELGVVPDTVVLRVRSNWGNKDYTCLYRVRVHGGQ
ncbi:hypothetical protein HDV05_002549 [Chytridiales sp. JEL 0842]|nr:hypothetical protein HDV05_002549 [Chytridiales sp. JEL 0842]